MGLEVKNPDPLWFRSRKFSLPQPGALFQRLAPEGNVPRKPHPALGGIDGVKGTILKTIPYREALHRNGIGMVQDLLCGRGGLHLIDFQMPPKNAIAIIGEIYSNMRRASKPTSSQIAFSRNHLFDR